MLFRVARCVLLSSCVSVAAIGLAAAADLPYPVKAPPPAPVVVAPPDSWAGFYLGGQVGYGEDAVRWHNLGGSAAFSPLGSVTHDRGNGVIGGGVEVKVAPRVSLGLEFMHTELGRRTDITSSSIGTAENYGVGMRTNSLMARFNYLFGR